MGQEVNHLKGSQIKSIFKELVQRENFVFATSVGTLVHNLLNYVNLFVDLFNLKSRYHLTSFYSQDVLKLLPYNFALEHVEVRRLRSLQLFW